MRSIKYILYIAVVALFAATSACKPEYVEKDGYAAPDSTKLDFTITKTGDFKVKVTNTSSIVGIPTYTDGNGGKLTNDGELIYNVKGTYRIKMTLYTKGGSASVTKTYTQTVDNVALLLSDKIKMLFGTVDDVNGKTWVLDSTETGHMGLCPGTGGDAAKSPYNSDKDYAKQADIPTDWWTCSPLQKTNTGMYKAELNFSFVGGKFLCSFKSMSNGYGVGVAAVKTIRANAYTNFGNDGGDAKFSYPAAVNGVTGTWEPSKVDASTYITIKPDEATKPIYTMFDIGSSDNRYKIGYIDADHMTIIGITGDGSGNGFVFKLVRKGYFVPEPSFDLATSAAAGENTFAASLSNIKHPVATATIQSVTYDFGDGSAAVTTKNEIDVLTHQYTIKGVYTITCKVISGSGAVFTKTQRVTVANNLTGYVPYLLNEMVLYSDFGETQLMLPAFDNGGQSGSATIVSNPDASKYPNRSANVCKYVKNSSEWANAFFKLPNGRRFSLVNQHIFKCKVYGKKGDHVLLKLENTDMGGDSWKTGVEAAHYVIKADDTWEEASFEFAGIANNGSADPSVSDVTTDSRVNDNYYNVIRIMYKPGDNKATYTFYFDDLAGPHVESFK